MTRAAWGVLLLLTACASPATPKAAPATSPAPAATTAAPSSAAATEANPVTAIWDVHQADPKSRDVALTFLAAACSSVRKVDVKETADQVVITLSAGTSAGRECTDPIRRHRTVRLSNPLGSRDLYDGGVSPAALVRKGT